MAESSEQQHKPGGSEDTPNQPSSPLESQDHSDRPIPPLQLFGLFFKIGALTFGGGVAMLGVMHHELVVSRGILSDEEFTDYVSLSTSVPGAIAVNMGYMLGLRFAGVLGVVLSVLGVVLPSVLIILFILLVLGGQLENPWITRFFTGASGAVAAQIAYSTLLFGKSVWRDVISMAVAVLCFALVLVTSLHPLLIVLIALVLRFILPHRGDGRYRSGRAG